MTGQKEYIITEERVQKWLELDFSAKDIARETREQPYDPEAIKAEEREKVLKKVFEKFSEAMCIQSEQRTIYDPEDPYIPSLECGEISDILKSLRLAGTMPAESGGLLK